MFTYKRYFCWAEYCVLDIYPKGAKHRAPTPGENFKHSCLLYLDIGVAKENTAA